MHSQAYQRLSALMRDDPSKALSMGEKLRLAIQLSELGLAMKHQQLKNANPNVSEARRTEVMDDWLLRRPTAPLGDSIGRPRTTL